MAHSDDYEKTINYRNDWVHGQPPTVADQGEVYDRSRKRWRLIEDTPETQHYQMHFAFGDTPMFKIEDIVVFVQKATALLCDTVSDVVTEHIKLVKARREAFNPPLEFLSEASLPPGVIARDPSWHG